jgi:hypothetical protein
MLGAGNSLSVNSRVGRSCVAYPARSASRIPLPKKQLPIEMNGAQLNTVYKKRILEPVCDISDVCGICYDLYELACVSMNM